MPRYIVKIIDKKENKTYYLEWSSVVDAPVTPGMDLETFKKYYLKGYGVYSINTLKDRLQRVEKQGTSCQLGSTLDDFISSNRAGDKGETIEIDQILDKYCRNQ